MGVRSIGLLPEERIERFVWSAINGRCVALEEHCAGGATQGDGAIRDFEPGALAKAENGRGVFVVEFANALFAGFVHQWRAGLTVDEVRIDLKWNEAERVEAWRKNNRHVVRCFNGWASKICSGAHAEIRRARADAIAESVEDTESIEGVEKAERVAATYEERLSVFDCGALVRHRVERFDEESRAVEVGRYIRTVSVVILQGVGDEKNARDGAIETQDVGGAIVEVGSASRDE